MRHSKSAIQHTLTTCLFGTLQDRNPQREYKHETTKREDRYIEHVLKQYDSLPLHGIINIIDAPMSEARVRRRPDEAGLESYILVMIL